MTTIEQIRRLAADASQVPDTVAARHVAGPDHPGSCDYMITDATEAELTARLDAIHALTTATTARNPGPQPRPQAHSPQSDSGCEGVASAAGSQVRR